MRQTSKKSNRTTTETLTNVLTEKTNLNTDEVLEYLDVLFATGAVNPIVAMGVSKRLKQISDTIKEKVYEQIQQQLQEEPVLQYGDYHITRRVVKNYLYPETPKLSALEKEFHTQQQKVKQLKDSINTVKKQMVIEGLAVEGPATIQAVVR